MCITQCDNRRVYKNRPKLRYSVIVATLSSPIINDRYNLVMVTFCTLLGSAEARNTPYNVQKLSYYHRNSTSAPQKLEMVSVDVETIIFQDFPRFVRNIEINGRVVCKLV